jgi:N-acetylmuramoyl-L-alanine amidase CwlA
MAWKGIVAKSFTAAEFTKYVNGLTWNTWKPKFIVVHNTATPSLAQRPTGLSLQHIRNLETYYRDQQKWSGGPHLFIDDRQIWVFNPLTMPGTHSPSFNATAIGIEMLGDFNKEAFDSGRGLKVREHTTWAIAKLSKKLDFGAAEWKWHNEDPATTHDCPGKNARNARQAMVREVMEDMQLTMRPPQPWDAILDDSVKGKVT